MRIIFLSKKKEEKHMRTIEKFTHIAIVNGKFRRDTGFGKIKLVRR